VTRPHAPGARARRGDAGLTLVEVMIVVTLVALVATVAIAVLTPAQQQMGVEQAARQIAADLSFARQDAMARREARAVVFRPSSGAYVVRRDGVPIVHPIWRRAYQVDIDRLSPGVDLTLSSVTFPGDSVRFDVDGVPSAGGKVALQAHDTTYEITVAAGSGRITVAEAGSAVFLSF